MRLSTLTTVSIALAPLFLQYVAYFDFILVPEIFLGVALLVAVHRKSAVTLKGQGFMLTYLFIACLATAFAAVFTPFFDWRIAGTSYARFLFYTLLVVVLTRHFNHELAARIVVGAAVLNASYGLLQYAAYHLAGAVLPWTVPILKLRYGELLINEQDYFFSEFGYRFSGLFSEPAHLSQYVGIALIILLYYPWSRPIENARKHLYFFICTTALVLSGSGTGFVIATTAVAAMALRVNNPILRTLIAGGLALASFTYWSSTGTVFSGLERISTFGDASSAYVRILRPFEVYLNLPLNEQIFGVGYANYAHHIFSNNLASAFELERNIAWTNTAAFVLVGTGLVSFVFFVAHFAHAMRYSSPVGMHLSAFALAHAFFSDLPLSLYYVLIMAFALSTTPIRLHKEARTIS